MIYLDNAATTKINGEVNKFMKVYAEENFFNPSGLYEPSLKVYKDIQNAKEKLLNLLNARNSKLVFTASATEANNMALRSLCPKRKKILVSMGEHACIYQTAKHLKDDGQEVDFIELNEDGTINLADLENKLTENTGFVSVIHVSNETGAVNDLKAIGKLIKQKCPTAIFHSDGVQAFCKIDVDLNDLGVDAYTISSHKIHGPRGAGALIYKSNLNPKPLIFGGGQEYGLRSGTENTPAILGFAMAAEIMHKSFTHSYEQVSFLKQTLLSKIEELHPIINSSAKTCSPYILSLSFEGVKGEVLVHMLEQDGIYVSTGSSCNSKHTGNRIMLAMNKTKQQEAGNIRISFCEDNTMEEIDIFAKALIKYVNEIRKLDIWKK